MKRFLMSVLAVGLFAGIVVAADQDVQSITIAAQAGTITQTVTSARLDGYLDSIYFDMTGISTVSVAVATADETVLSVSSALLTDKWYKPRSMVHDVNGAQISGAGTNDWERFMLVGDKLTFTVVRAAPTGTAVTISFRIKLDDK